QQLLNAAQGIEVSWAQLTAGHPLVGRSLAEADIRSQTGVSVVAIFRDGQLLPNPKSGTVFEAGDRIAMIGDADHLGAAEAWLTPAAAGPQTDPAAA
ncbi:MAG: hypothetical protein JNK29_00830, partial [Anaerolineales bacterium]|nr:hypothetical protein [Anaerolineales bacterium]